MPQGQRADREAKDHLDSAGELQLRLNCPGYRSLYTQSGNDLRGRGPRYQTALSHGLGESVAMDQFL